MDPQEIFATERKENIRKMQKDLSLKELALKFLVKSFRYNYSYNFDWLGRPFIQVPQDIVALQEIIWKTKPDLIIETGIAHGGGLIFYASMLELLGEGEVIGIDVEIRPHNRKEIEKHPLSKRIIMFEGSSTDNKIVKEVEKVVKRHKKVMVCLDSLHTHEHVLNELNIYSKFVTKGNYLVVFDTVIEFFPKGFFKDRPWDKGNNPYTAVKEFLKHNKNFVVDKEIENKLLITCAPGGYLLRVR
jgi:cephalosporin hydroxylase